ARPIVGVAKALGFGNVEALSFQVGHRTFEGQGAWPQAVDDDVVAGFIQGGDTRGFVPPLSVHARKPQVRRLDDVRVRRQQTGVVGFGHAVSFRLWLIARALRSLDGRWLAHFVRSLAYGSLVALPLWHIAATRRPYAIERSGP